MCNNLKCKYCNSSRINKIGILNGKQRYFCREAQSPSYASLLAITNLLLGEVPKRLKGARSAKPNRGSLSLGKVPAERSEAENLPSAEIQRN